MATISKYETSGGATLYEVRYRTPARKSTRKRGFETLRDARAFAATVETSKLKGEYVGVSTGRATIGELGPAWLDRQRGHLKPKTFESYENLWRVHVAPRWSGVRISEVRFTDVASWVAGMSADSGPSLVRGAHMVLRFILDDAVRDRMLVSNPAAGVSLPKLPPRRNTYLTAAQLDAFADECGPYRSLILLLGVGGLRWGEAVVLRPRDVDFLRRRIELHRNAVRVYGRYVVGTLKNNKNRTIAVPGFVIDALAQTAEGKDREDLLWTTSSTRNSTAGRFLNPPHHGFWYYNAIERCQAVDPTFPRVTPHALRHTAASLAISSGANPKVVQRMLGHASAAMTLDTYADLFECDLDTVVENVTKLFGRSVR